MTPDHEFERGSQPSEFGSSSGVDDPAWRIDWDRTRPARLVGDRARTNGLAVGDPAPPAAAQPPSAPRRAGRPQRRTIMLVLGALFLLAAGAAAVLVLVDRFEDDAPGSGQAPPLEQAEPLGQSLSTDGGPDLRREYPPRRTFVTGGVRFKVTSRPQQQWARDTLTLAPGAARAWHTVSVQYRNLARRSLTAEGLRFRLRDARGSLYAPSDGAGNQGTELPAGAQIPAGTLIHGQLAFRVREGRGPYALLIDASPSRRVRIEFASG